MELETKLGWCLFPGLFAVVYPPDQNEALSVLLGNDVHIPERGPFVYRMGDTIVSSFATKHRIKELPKEHLKKLIFAMCTVNHEMAHIRQMSFSTLGIWLVQQRVGELIKVSTALSNISQAGAKAIKLPLWKWGQSLKKSKVPWESELWEITSYLLHASEILCIFTETCHLFLAI